MPSESSSNSSIVLRVAVGSLNPSKIKAVRQALEKALTGVSNEVASSIIARADVQGFDVNSGVSHQPFGDAETRTGAKNRAKAAYMAYYEERGLQPHLAIGMEGGLEWVSHSTEQNDSAENGVEQQQGDESEEEENDGKSLFCMAWIAIFGKRSGDLVDLFASADTQSYNGDRKPIYGVSKTASFPLPPAITKLVIEDGMELGDADDKVFDRVKSKHGSGTVGILSKGLIDRSHYYDHALLLAFIPWMRPDLYPKGF